MATIAGLNISIGANSAKLTKELGKADRKLKNFSRQATRKLKRVGSGLKTVSLAATAVGGAFALMGRNSLKAVDDLAKTSRTIGVTVEKMQSYSLIASRGGLDTKKFAKSMKIFSKTVRDAGRGLGLGNKAFNDLGINVRDNNGQLKNHESLLGEVADKFSSMKDGVNKTALAMDLFGGNGASMINILNSGSESLKRQREEFNKLGITVSTFAAQQVEAANDAMGDLGFIASQTGKKLMSELAPQIKQLADNMKAFLSETDGDGISRLRRFTNSVSMGFREMVSDSRIFVAGIQDIFNKLGLSGGQGVVAALLFGSAGISAAKSAITATMTSLTRKLMVSLAPLFARLSTAGAAIMSGPIGWITLGLTTAVLTYSYWDDLKPSFEKMWTDMKSWWGGLDFASLWSGLTEGFSAKLDEMKRSLTTWWEGLLPSKKASLPRADPREHMGSRRLGQRYSTGGSVYGAGTATSDSIPAWLSNGEYVVNAKSAARYRGLLEQMNQNRFSTGGSVGSHQGKVELTLNRQNIATANSKIQEYGEKLKSLSQESLQYQAVQKELTHWTQFLSELNQQQTQTISKTNQAVESVTDGLQKMNTALSEGGGVFKALDSKLQGRIFSLMQVDGGGLKGFAKGILSDIKLELDQNLSRVITDKILGRQVSDRGSKRDDTGLLSRFRDPQRVSEHITDGINSLREPLELLPEGMKEIGNNALDGMNNAVGFISKGFDSVNFAFKQMSIPAKSTSNFDWIGTAIQGASLFSGGGTGGLNVNAPIGLGLPPAIGTLGGGITAIRKAKGGMVPQYLANGGNVGVGPKGTDTIPAWLTPGEVVLNQGQQKRVASGLTSKPPVNVTVNYQVEATGDESFKKMLLESTPMIHQSIQQHSQEYFN
jgi:hypothetical protein